MYRVVMVPTDGSELSRHAIPLALAVARPAHAPLHLVAVLDPTFEAPIYGIPVDSAGWTGGLVVDPAVEMEVRTAQWQAEEAALRTFAERLSADAGVSVTGALLESGDVAPILAGYAGAHDVGLIVIATHGRGGLGRALLGSVADALVRDAPCPMLLARPRGSLTNESEPAPITHVLVPLDDTPESETVVPHAAAIAALTGARCTLLHASHPEILGGVAVPPALLDPVAMQHADEAERARLERLAEPVRARGVSVATEVLHVKAPVDAIVDYAATNAVDLIAMTTRAERGVARLMRGSTATTLLQRTQLPMLVTRADTPPPA